MSEPYLDTSALDNLSQFLNAEKLQALLDRYLQDSQMLLNQLEDALADNNVSEAHRMVHSLKSTSANVGAMPISKLAKEVEALAKAGQLTAVSEQLPALKAAFEATQTAIEQLELMRARKTG